MKDPLAHQTFAEAQTKHGHEILDQFIHHVGYRTRLTHESKVLFLGFFKSGRPIRADNISL